MDEGNGRLREVYGGVVRSLERIVVGREGVSRPLFLCVPDGYTRSSIRLLVIGQQTYGWAALSVGLDRLLESYGDFDLGRNYTSSPWPGHRTREAGTVRLAVCRNGASISTPPAEQRRLLQGKPHNSLVGLLFFRTGSHKVRCRCQFEREVSRPSRKFFGRSASGPIVRHRRRHHQNVARCKVYVQ